MVPVWQMKWIQSVTYNVEKWLKEEKKGFLSPLSISSEEKDQLTMAGMQIFLQMETHMHLNAILLEGLLLMLRNPVFMVRNVEIWAVLPCNEVHLLMLRNRVIRLRNVQKWAVPSRKGFDFLMRRNRLFRLRNFRYRQCRHETTLIF